MWPRTYTLFEKYDLYGVSFSRSEMKAFRRIYHDGYDSDAAVDEAGLTGSKVKEFFTKMSEGGKRIL